MAASTTRSTSFGDYLRFLRRQARLTQTELSIAVGYSPGQISMLENGQRHPDPTTVAALFIAALGIEKDAEASRQLIALAEAAAGQQLSSTPGHTPSHTSGQAAAKLVEKKYKGGIEKSVAQMIVRQQEELGVLEEIPPAPSYLVQRSRPVQQAEERLNRERVTALCGLAGMGKSTLAAQIARRYSKAHPVFWLTLADIYLSGPEALLRQLALFVAVHSGNPQRFAPFARMPSAAEPAVHYHQQLALVAAGLAVLDAPLLVFDDAHLLRNAVLIRQMLNRLLLLTPNCRILYVTREEIDLPGILHITLEGMERDEAVALTKLLAQRAAFDIDSLLRLTGGSPMLLRLALNLLEQQPRLELADVSRSFASYLVDTALTALERSARRLLEFISVYRNPVDLTNPHLAEFLSHLWHDYDHRAAVGYLQRNRLVDHASYAVPNPILREPVLTELTAQPEILQQTHAAAAQWALALGDSNEAAHHLLHADEMQRACDLLTASEADSRSFGQSMATVAVIEEILAVARSQQRIGANRNDVIRRLLILHGDLLVNTTRSEEAHNSYAEAMALTMQSIDRAQLAGKMATVRYQRGEMEEALALCEQATQMLGANLTQEGIHLRIAVETTRLRVLITLTRFGEAQRLCEQALNLVRPMALFAPRLADNVRANANLALGYIARFEGDVQRARQHLLKSVKYAHSAKAASVEGDALSLLSTTLRDLGDFNGAEAIGQQALDIAYALDNEYLTSSILHHLSLADYYHAALEQCLTRSERVLQIKQAMGDIDGMVASRLVRSLALAAQGKVTDALRCAQQAADDCALLENSWLRGVADYGVGVVLSFTEDLAGAERCIEHALRTEELKLDRPFYCGAEVYIGMIYVAQGRLDEAQPIIDRVLPKGAGYSAELLQELVHGMWLLAQGQRAAAHTCATQLIERARACGFLIYATEARRLAELTQAPPVLAELPRRVCCAW